MAIKSILLLISFLFTAQALACECADMRGEAREYLKNSYSVFLGIPITDSILIPSNREYGQEVKTKFKVVKSLKSSPKEVLVYAEKADGGNCGVNFEKNKGMFLVFTYLLKGKLLTNGCSVASDSYATDLLLELL